MAIIRRPVARKADAHITKELYKRNLELAERNKTMLLLKHIDEVVLSSSANDAPVTQSITDLLVSEAEFSLAAIYVSGEDKSRANNAGVSTSIPIPAEAEKILKDDLIINKLKQEFLTPNSTHLISGMSKFNTERTKAQDKYLSQTFGIRSYFICPLEAKSGFIGILKLGLPFKERDISAYQKNLAVQLSGAIGIAVENYLLYKELQKATARLSNQNKKLRTLDAMKDDFISMVSHQLRTPATSVHEAIIMLNEEKLTPSERKRLLQLVEASSEHLVNVVVDMLSIARIQAGRFSITKEKVIMQDLVKRAISEAGVLADQKKIEIVFKEPAKPIEVQADRGKINEAMANYIDNAIKYSEPNSQVSINLEKSNNRIVFEVSDGGIGVPPSQRKNLFTKFYRAKNAKMEHPDGNGIGLFVVQTIAQAHGGDVYYKPIESGSMFGFWLPA